MISREVFSGWSYTEDYDEFVQGATEELAEIGQDILAAITPDTVRKTLWHPNGFLYALPENEAEGQLRLYIWPTGNFVGLTPHSHPWHMTSLILAGVYTEYVPDVKLDADSEHQLMGTNFDENRQQVGNGYTGQNVSFVLGELTSYKTGQYHSLPAGEFHITPLPQAEAIVTLVRTSRQYFPNPSYVLSEVNKEAQLTNAVDRKSPSEDEVLKIWGELVPLLEKV